jgi:thioredoxin-like negative regulator of GroEL
VIFLTQEDQLKFDTPFQVLYFYLPQMPFHSKMLIMLNKMEKKYPIMTVFAIDTDYFKTICKRFRIEALPEIVIMHKRNQIKRISGIIATQDFNQIFDDIYQRNTSNTEKSI